MSAKELRAELIELFKETGHVHHQAFIEADGADPEWPIWYAEYAQARLNRLLQTPCSKSELVYLLVTVEKERAQKAPEAFWAEYYTDFFLERYAPMHGRMPEAPNS